MLVADMAYNPYMPMFRTLVWAGDCDALGNLVLDATFEWYELYELLDQIWFPGLAYSIRYYQMYDTGEPAMRCDGMYIKVHRMEAPDMVSTPDDSSLCVKRNNCGTIVSLTWACTEKVEMFLKLKLCVNIFANEEATVCVRKSMSDCSAHRFNVCISSRHLVERSPGVNFKHSS